MAARNGGILKSLLKIVVRQFLDDKHGSKLAATVTINQKYTVSNVFIVDCVDVFLKKM